VNDLQKWLAAIRDGDRVAFEALYEYMKKPLFTVALKITQNTAMAEDVLQEVFIKLFLSPPQPSTNPRAYLCRMVRNLAIDSVRKRREEVDFEDAENTIYHPVENLALQIDVKDAIMSLPERERQIVTLRISGELRFREVAAIMELPLGTVLWAYQKAIKQLQNDLGGLT